MSVYLIYVKITVVCTVSCAPLFVTPWTVAHQAPLFIEFSRQEYWSGLPFLSPGNLSDPRIEPRSPALQANYLPSQPPGKPKRTIIHDLISTIILVFCLIFPHIPFFPHFVLFIWIVISLFHYFSLINMRVMHTIFLLFCSCL